MRYDPNKTVTNHDIDSRNSEIIPGTSAWVKITCMCGEVFTTIVNNDGAITLWDKHVQERNHELDHGNERDRYYEFLTSIPLGYDDDAGAVWITRDRETGYASVNINIDGNRVSAKEWEHISEAVRKTQILATLMNASREPGDTTNHVK